MRIPLQTLILIGSASLACCAGRQAPATSSGADSAEHSAPSDTSVPSSAGDRGALKDPGQQFVLVVAELIELLTAHQDNCDETLDKASGWIEDHRQDLVVIEQRPEHAKRFEAQLDFLDIDYL